MKDAFIVRRGGSGGGSGAGGINFDVKAYASSDLLPGGEKENTIAAITDVGIPRWTLSAFEPESAENGLLWLELDFASDVIFNALQKNELIVGLSRAYQCIDGAFNPIEAYIYNGTSWVDFSSAATYLYFAGDTCEELTGGYKAEGKKSHSGTAGTQTPSVAYNDESMRITSAGNSTGAYRGGIVYTTNKIDLSKYDTLIFEGTVSGVGSSSCGLRVWSSIGSNYGENVAGYVKFANGSDPVTLDVSDLTESYYIGLSLEAASSTLTIDMTSLRLE